MTEAADTWGISSGSFLAFYAVLAVVVLLVCRGARRSLADPRGQVGEPDTRRHPHDLAFLNGGPPLAVYSALSAMNLRGTITSERGTVRAAGRLDPGPDELERSIHRAAASGVHRNRLITHHSVCTVLDASKQRLVKAGLLLSDEQRGRIRRVGLWMVAVALLGLLRVLAGMSNAQPVGLVTAMMVAVSVVAIFLLARAPSRAKAGDRLLARLRTEQHGLAPANRPDWAVYGPEGAALGIGIWGMSALWASDPVFADELALQRQASTGDGGSGGGGDSGGGSDGGGGGGGGGCGGGGCGG
ncbi:TIGR04222 domain-containing membrane protein [Pseudonocardia lacus]|uniref:TIGR04222 domain-containing membrane protein n=1 Tax=Pseudonocardia lacus TaxID=2835865 RepID=UPI001BDD9188|nr:TIGR04222 domain-containing membrane protein [Pseudonocardia lacus]